MEDEKTAARALPRICHIWGPEAAAEVGSLFGEFRVSDELLEKIRATAQHIDAKKGFAAEVVVCESVNLDAIVKDSQVRAYTDKHPGTPIRPCDQTTDLLVTGGQAGPVTAQLKFYKTGEKTQVEFREIKNGEIKYKEVDVMLGPSDQLVEVRDAARRTELKNAETRPQVAEAAREVQAKASDKVSVDGVESKPLSHDDAKKIANGGGKADEIVQQRREEYLDTSLSKQSLNAAKSAAVITAVISGTVNSCVYLNEVRGGRMSGSEAAERILVDTSIAAADAALKGGVATASVSYAARSIPSLFTGGAFSNAMTAGALAGAAVCAVDLVECLVLFACGRMTGEELQTRTGTNVFQTGAGVVGSAIGGTIGAIGGPPGVLIGSFIGGMITSLAMTIAIDNHIEGPFKETLANAAALARSQELMQDSIHLLAIAEGVFKEFQPAVLRSEVRFQGQIAHLDQQNAEIRRALEEI